ncbi:MAG: hypothetical protein H6Q16_2122, partial [Bacteroidetes bacterium]|nr:hypothetical protein [Bacteroidota bacterium]
MLQKNTYTYDNVGNITQIKGDGINPFEHNYTYDASYRLTDANGNGTWLGNNLTYEQSFTYSPSGRINNKKTTSQKLSNQYGLYNEVYDNTYSYNFPNNPYAVDRITNTLNGKRESFSWDVKGNMVAHRSSSNEWRERYLCWTEDNR